MNIIVIKTESDHWFDQKILALDAFYFFERAIVSNPF